MVEILYKTEEGEQIYIQREIGATYDELVELFYSLSLAAGYSSVTIDKYLDCESNDWALSSGDKS